MYRQAKKKRPRVHLLKMERLLPSGAGTRTWSTFNASALSISSSIAGVVSARGHEHSQFRSANRYGNQQLLLPRSHRRDGTLLAPASPCACFYNLALSTKGRTCMEVRARGYSRLQHKSGDSASGLVHLKRGGSNFSCRFCVAQMSPQCTLGFWYALAESRQGR